MVLPSRRLYSSTMRLTACLRRGRCRATCGRLAGLRTAPGVVRARAGSARRSTRSAHARNTITAQTMAHCRGVCGRARVVNAAMTMTQTRITKTMRKRSSGCHVMCARRVSYLLPWVCDKPGTSRRSTVGQGNGMRYGPPHPRCTRQDFVATGTSSTSAINAGEMSFPSRGASSAAKGSAASRPHPGDTLGRHPRTRRS